jgi:hypothetical protein
MTEYISLVTGKKREIMIVNNLHRDLFCCLLLLTNDNDLCH